MLEAWRSRAVQLAVVGGPLVLLLLIRMLHDPSATAAAIHAASSAETAVLPNVPPVVDGPGRLTEAQHAGIAWAANLDPEAPLPSPFANLRSAPEESVRESEHAPARSAVLDLQLRSVMGRGASAVASISGRIYRSNDQVLPGWRIHQIDTLGSTVELRSAGGETQILTVQR